LQHVAILQYCASFSNGRNRRQYSLRLATEGWPGWVDLGGWLRRQTPSPTTISGRRYKFV